MGHSPPISAVFANINTKQGFIPTAAPNLAMKRHGPVIHSKVRIG
jgi:hypothetical protein